MKELEDLADVMPAAALTAVEAIRSAARLRPLALLHGGDHFGRRDVAQVAVGDGERRVAELIPDHRHWHALGDELGGVRVAHLVRHDPPLNPACSATRRSMARTYCCDIGAPWRVHRRVRPRMPA